MAQGPQEDAMAEGMALDLAASPVEIAGILHLQIEGGDRAAQARAADPRVARQAQKQRLMARFEAAEEPWACFQQAQAGIGGGAAQRVGGEAMAVIQGVAGLSLMKP